VKGWNRLCSGLWAVPLGESFRCRGMNCVPLEMKVARSVETSVTTRLAIQCRVVKCVYLQQ
jgi:hypothetical protein